MTVVRILIGEKKVVAIEYLLVVVDLRRHHHRRRLAEFAVERGILLLLASFSFFVVSFAVLSSLVGRLKSELCNFGGVFVCGVDSEKESGKQS